jgi:SagB-type dehydrogenase family enzyme
VARASHTYQAVSGVVCYWQDDALVLHDPFSRRRHAVTPLVVALMHACREPRSFAAIHASCPGVPAPFLRKVLSQLATSGVIVRSADRLKGRSPAADWGSWSPVASFFHYATKDVPWASGEALQALEDSLSAKAAVDPPPAPMKRGQTRTTVALPRAPADGEFRSVLLDRRTWRGFARTPVPLGQLAELLDLTFGVRGWVSSDEGGERLPLKTSPSGGGRHPVEAYVLAANVRGLARGLYRYAPDHHRLELIRRGATARQIETYLGGQWWYRPAAAVVLMTAVLPRVWWRYDMPRAYRSVLLDAGHICQTFCLVATALRLAPFCTMALADSQIERDLGIDGISEVVLYAAGIGMRPDGPHVQWPARPKGRTYVSPERD